IPYVTFQVLFTFFTPFSSSKEWNIPSLLPLYSIRKSISLKFSDGAGVMSFTINKIRPHGVIPLGGTRLRSGWEMDL
ncbi:hypothetical protein B0F90DRAFT_1767329, partial [Multifurca ochricompacta]